MRKGGMTFDERDVFAVGEDCNPSPAYDQGKFFDSFYRVDSGSELNDRSTIGHMVSRAAARFHYNAVENSILKTVAHRDGTPYGASVRTWEFAQSRRNLRLLDVGSGTGHWIDFFFDAMYVTEAIGIEVATNILDFLTEKYARRTDVEILQLDVSSDSVSHEELGGKFDYISAIGVLFHITDDGRWLQALRNLRSLLAEDGLIFAGGDFGWETRDLQFHRVDEFDDWQAQRDEANSHKVFVNKRVRSLADWHRAASAAGLVIADVLRVDSDWAIPTPENDILVLTHGDRR